jgi:hypothetical protein
MVVNLVEMTGVEELVDKVKKGKYKSINEILAKKSRSFYVTFEHYEPISYCRGDCHI